ncbi:hypothetical protein P167DRAFT_578350 [Morchella conica CCBAS932]|uniref:Uncharacterized protein n=1 Tax=Morchella conica CCBAS932 TaxID=1392247 RepID=A0A3N4KD17_9PEZI|nr:hypothetical protein P167DRAFT_578350 [Morchella conica CCBAS932]
MGLNQHISVEKDTEESIVEDTEEDNVAVDTVEETFEGFTSGGRHGGRSSKLETASGHRLSRPMYLPEPKPLVGQRYEPNVPMPHACPTPTQPARAYPYEHAVTFWINF